MRFCSFFLTYLFFSTDLFENTPILSVKLHHNTVNVVMFHNTSLCYASVGKIWLSIKLWYDWVYNFVKYCIKDIVLCPYTITGICWPKKCCLSHDILPKCNNWKICNSVRPRLKACTIHSAHLFSYLFTLAHLMFVFSQILNITYSV